MSPSWLPGGEALQMPRREEVLFWIGKGVGGLVVGCCWMIISKSFFFHRFL